jgi:hypothetical protein
LRRHADWRQSPVVFSHYRDKDQVEVDVVMEAAGRLAGVEVKAGSRVDSNVDGHLGQGMIMASIKISDKTSYSVQFHSLRAMVSPS